MPRRKHTPCADGALLDLADQLHSAALHLLRRIRVRDVESGIGPAQLSALSVLVFGGPRSTSELAHAEQVRLPTMSRTVAGLERAELIRREPMRDRRSTRLTATAKGTRLLWAGRHRRVALLARAIGELAADRQQRVPELADLLEDLVRRM